MSLYLQLAAALRERINNGTLQPGHALPSETELMEEFNVARITARAAHRHLRDEGVVYTIQGEGSFVGPESAPRVSRRRLVHREIAEKLAEQVRTGRLQPDNPIPSETTLMQEHGVAKGTVRAAVKLLREQGWVFTVPHRGTYVAPRKDWPKERS